MSLIKNFYKPNVVITLTLFLSLLIYNTALAQTKTSAGSGDWNVAGTWSPAGVPTAGNDVIITSNHKVNIVSNSACRSLTVGTGSTAQLRFDNGTNLTFTVGGNIVIGANAQFRIRGQNATHTLFANGDITNNGTLDLFRSANKKAELILIRGGNQNISGAGIYTEFYLIKLQMGASFNNIADFSTSSFVVSNDFLTLTSGTFKYSVPSATNISPYTSAVTIPANGGLWMNSAPSVMSLPNGIIFSGKLSNSNGTINVGSANNETLLYSGGTFSFTGGVTNIAGRFNGNVAASTCNFNMSGGNFNVPSVSTNNTTDAPFQIGAAGSQFNMSGGTILVNREGGTGTQDLGYVNLAGSGAVTGGTVQIGSATSPATQVMKINSTALIPNLVLNNATTTASLLTNAMTVTNTIKITLGTLNSNNLGITLGGNWQNNGGTFTPGTSTVTFNSSSAQSIFKAGGETFNHLRFSGTGVKSFSAPVTANGNFSISAGSSVDVSSTNHQLTAKGNFINSGTFNSQSGLVFLNGVATQTIGGSSTTDFFDITLSNALGARLTNPENLIGTLTLTSGTFSTNLQMFTMVSTATATARIAQITGGDINGPVRVQRYAPGGTTGWAFLGTPISSALSLTDWDDNIAISCPTCPDGYVPNFPSIYTYDETATGTYSDAASYIPLSTINDPIVANKGYWVYLGDGFTTTNPITLDVIGTVRKGNQTIPLNYTNNSAAADIGWNLIHNPYPSPISWALLKGATANIDNAIYVFNADLNGGAGANASYVNGVSSPAVGSGGIGDAIPMCQGFYVHSTGATALNATEANKVASNQVFLRDASTQSTLDLLRVNMSGGPNNYSDETVVYTQQGATSNFDSDYDAIKMAGQDVYAPTIQIENGTDIFQINGVPSIAGTYTTSLKTLTGYAGIYTISASEIIGFPIGTCIKLFDKFTNTTTDLNTSNYVFNLADTTTVARFVLSITLNQLQITSNLIQPTCQNLTGGEIIAIGNNAGPWNYYWKDGQGNPIQTTLNKPTADTLQSLWTGNYQLDVTTVGGCDNNHSTYAIIQKDLPYSNFTCVDTCFLDLNPTVLFNNTTPNSVSQTWNFGDSNTSTVFAPQHQYSSVGNYMVTLVGNSSSGCVDSIARNVIVVNKAVGIKSLSYNGELKIRTISNNHYIIEQELRSSANLGYTLKDAQGKLVLEQSKRSVNGVNIDLDLSNYQAGIYFLSIELDKKTSVQKLSVSK